MPLEEIDYTPTGDTRLEADNKINAAIEALNNLQGGAADQIPKKTGAGDFDFEMTNSILPGAGISGNMKIKKVSIGDWDMDASAQVTIAHGLNYSKIAFVSALIYNDFYDGAGNGIVHNLLSNTTTGTTDSSRITWNSTVITLTRIGGGYFDDPTFNATSFNRGCIYITYEE